VPQLDGAGAQARLLALAVVAGASVWIGLTGAEPRSLVVGVPTVAAAAVAARVAGAGRHLPRAWAAPGFALRLLAEIFVSAWSVGRRLFAREPGFAPALTHYTLRLRGEGARAAFMNAVTLTPGTLSAGLDGDRLAVHALDGEAGLAPALEALEVRVAGLYGEPAPATRRARVDVEIAPEQAA
jgi:multicomponent Na+:H+ antiporter subunit E